MRRRRSPRPVRIPEMSRWHGTVEPAALWRTLEVWSDTKVPLGLPLSPVPAIRRAQPSRILPHPLGTPVIDADRSTVCQPALDPSPLPCVHPALDAGLSQARFFSYARAWWGALTRFGTGPRPHCCSVRPRMDGDEWGWMGEDGVGGWMARHERAGSW